MYLSVCVLSGNRQFAQTGCFEDSSVEDYFQSYKQDLGKATKDGVLDGTSDRNLSPGRGLKGQRGEIITNTWRDACTDRAAWEELWSFPDKVISEHLATRKPEKKEPGLILLQPWFPTDWCLSLSILSQEPGSKPTDLVSATWTFRARKQLEQGGG